MLKGRRVDLNYSKVDFMLNSKLFLDSFSHRCVGLKMGLNSYVAYMIDISRKLLFPIPKTGFSIKFFNTLITIKNGQFSILAIGILSEKDFTPVNSIE